VREIRAIIVDDELPARKGLRNLLSREPDIRIVQECQNGPAAVVAIKADKPDVVFLDIQMPGMNGFEVLAALAPLTPAEMPIVIFVTAFDEYALRAFTVHALDYLLKPIDAERFRQTLDRMREQMHGRRPQDIDGKLLDLLTQIREEKQHIEKIVAGGADKRASVQDRLLIKSGEKMVLLAVEKIDWIEATGDYITIHAGPQRHLIRETMTSIEARLDKQKFLRIHRSTIVNVDRIAELRPLFAGDYRVVLQNGVQLTLTRTHRNRLRQFLEKFE